MKNKNIKYYSVGRPDINLISKIDTISTAAFRGKEFELTAERVCIPLSPKIFALIPKRH